MQGSRLVSFTLKRWRVTTMSASETIELAEKA